MFCFLLHILEQCSVCSVVKKTQCLFQISGVFFLCMGLWIRTNDTLSTFLKFLADDGTTPLLSVSALICIIIGGIIVVGGMFGALAALMIDQFLLTLVGTTYMQAKNWSFCLTELEKKLLSI